MVNKIDFKAKNQTSNAGIFLLLENANSTLALQVTDPSILFVRGEEGRERSVSRISIMKS